MNNEPWKNDEQRELDLALENQSLETELMLQGGMTVKSEDIDPRLENAFLKNVIAFEEADKEPMVQVRTLFPEGFQFPPVASLSPSQLSQKIEEIAEILAEHTIEFGFADTLPDPVLYKYLVEEYIPTEMVRGATQAGFTWNIDGCDGGCDECFQKKYCSTAEEILKENPDSQDAE